VIKKKAMGAMHKYKLLGKYKKIVICIITS